MKMESPLDRIKNKNKNPCPTLRSSINVKRSGTIKHQNGEVNENFFVEILQKIQFLYNIWT